MNSMVLRSASRRVFQAAQKTQQRSVTDITKIKEKRAKFYKDSNYGTEDPIFLKEPQDMAFTVVTGGLLTYGFLSIVAGIYQVGNNQNKYLLSMP